MTDENAYVYQCFDAAGTLLYIGTTKNVEQRFNQHRHRSHWFSQVVRTKIRAYASQAEASNPESELIWQLQPVYNVQFKHYMPPHLVYRRENLGKRGNYDHKTAKRTPKPQP